MTIANNSVGLYKLYSITGYLLEQINIYQSSNLMIGYQYLMLDILSRLLTMNF